MNRGRINYRALGEKRARGILWFHMRARSRPTRGFRVILLIFRQSGGLAGGADWIRTFGTAWLKVLDSLLTVYKVALEFEFILLHHPVFQIHEISENYAKSARVRAISDCAWTRRTPSEALLVGIAQNLSTRDFARSVCKAKSV